MLLRLTNLLKDMVKKLPSLERKSINYSRGLNIKELLTSCSIEFLITVSFLSIFPEARTQKLFQNSLKSLLLCTDIWVVCLQNINAGSLQVGSLPVAWFFSPCFITSPAEMHFLQREYKVQEGRLHFGLNLIYDVKWTPVDCTILKSFNRYFILHFLHIMEKYILSSLIQSCSTSLITFLTLGKCFGKGK